MSIIWSILTLGLEWGSDNESGDESGDEGGDEVEDSDNEDSDKDKCENEGEEGNELEVGVEVLAVDNSHEEVNEDPAKPNESTTKADRVFAAEWQSEEGLGGALFVNESFRGHADDDCSTFFPIHYYT